MGYGAYLLSNVYKRFKDWADDTANTGDNVTDLALDAINQARDELRMHQKWEELMVRATLSITDRVATLPDDIGEVLWVAEVDGNGRRKKFYFQNSNDTSRSYVINNTYDQTAPHSQTWTFIMAPSGNIDVAYIKRLPDFTAAQVANGADPVYLFFTENLLLTKAKEIYLLDGDMITDELGAVQAKLEKLLGDFEEAHQWVNYDLKIDILDDYGQVMDMEIYDMQGGLGPSNSRYDNSYDNRGPY